MDGQGDVCLLDVLLPDTITQILKLLAHCPESIIAFALSCSQAQAICSADAALWADLCMSVLQTCPQQIRDQDWSPSAWSAESHMHLYIGLLHPYRALLQQRTWRTTRMPAGQMLVIDAQPPKLIARSVFYRTLQGQAFAHPVFLVRVPTSINKAKAKAYCCLCDAAKSLSADVVYGTEFGFSGNVHAHLQFYTQPTALLPLPTSSLNSSDKQQGAGTVAACQPLDTTTSFALACSRSCGILYCERMARWRIGQPYGDDVATGGAGSSAGAAAVAAPASDNDSSSSLPLPDVREPVFSAWDMQQLATELDYPPSWRSSAIFRPLNLSCWLNGDAPCADQATGPAAALPSTTSTSPQPLQSAPYLQTAASAPEQLTGLWRGSYGVHGVELVHLQLVASSQRAGIAQQYRQAMQAALTNFQECPGGVLLHSLLKTSAPQWPPGFVHSESPTDQEDGPAAAAGTGEVPLHLPEAPAGAATEAPPDASGDSSSSSARSVGEGTSRGCMDATQPQQQVLLVATKLTGDRNVPAGQLTFAVDLSSSSTTGAGQRLQLPFGTYSDVVMSSEDHRPLIIKVSSDMDRSMPGVVMASSVGSPYCAHGDTDTPPERDVLLHVQERFTGMAQVAETYFQNPRMMPVELLVFEDPSCLGLWWKAPMDSFSLLVRLQHLP